MNGLYAPRAHLREIPRSWLLASLIVFYLPEHLQDLFPAQQTARAPAEDFKALKTNKIARGPTISVDFSGESPVPMSDSERHVCRSLYFRLTDYSLLLEVYKKRATRIRLVARAV